MEVSFCLGAMLYALTILCMKAVMPAERFSASITSTGFWVTAVILFSILSIVSFWINKSRVKSSPEEDKREQSN